MKMEEINILVWPDNEDEDPEITAFKISGELDLSWFEEGFKGANSNSPSEGIQAKIAEAIPEENIPYWVRIVPIYEDSEDDPGLGIYDCEIVEVQKEIVNMTPRIGDTVYVDYNDIYDEYRSFHGKGIFKGDANQPLLDKEYGEKHVFIDVYEKDKERNTDCENCIFPISSITLSE